METKTIQVQSNQMEEIAGLTSQYPYVLHRADLSVTRVPWHWHEELEFNYIKRGTMRVNTAGNSFLFHEGEGFFINTNILCNMENVEDCLMDSHLFHSTFLSGHFRSIFETKYLDPVLHNRTVEILPLRGSTPQQQKLLRLLQKAGQLQEQENVEFQTRNLFSEIWLLLLEEIGNMDYVQPTVQPARRERLQTMLAFIQQNYARKLTLDEIAASALIGRREALRCFSVCIGRTPFEYLLEYRIEMSQKLLKNSALSITEIALQTGFSGSAYFAKLFRRTCGMTPGAYRKANRS